MSGPMLLPEWYDGVPAPIADWVRRNIDEGVITHGAWSDGLLFAASAIAELMREDLDHAVASERERVAVWLEKDVKILHQITDIKFGRTTHRDEYLPATQLADAIRNGAHNGQAATGGEV